MSFFGNCSLRKIIKAVLLSIFAVSALFGIALAAGVTTVKITEDKTKPEEITTSIPGFPDGPGGEVDFACNGSARIPIENILWERNDLYQGENSDYSNWCIFIPSAPRSRLPYGAQCALYDALPISIHDDLTQKSFEIAKSDIDDIQIIQFGGETNRRGEFSWFDGTKIDFMESELASGTGELYLDSAGWEVKSVMRNVSAHFACYVDQKALTTVTSTASSASTSSSSRPTLSSTTTTSKTTTTPLLTTTTTEEITLGWSYCDSAADKTKILWTTTPIYDGANDQFKDWCVYIPREPRQSGLSVDEHCQQFFGFALSIHDQNLQNSIERVFREFSEVSIISVGGQKDARNEDFYWQDNSDVDYKKRELNGMTVGTGELVYTRTNFQNGKWELTKNENTLSHSHFACYQKIPEKEGSAEIIEDYLHFQPLF